MMNVILKTSLGERDSQESGHFAVRGNRAISIRMQLPGLAKLEVPWNREQINALCTQPQETEKWLNDLQIMYPSVFLAP